MARRQQDIEDKLDLNKYQAPSQAETEIPDAINQSTNYMEASQQVAARPRKASVRL